MNRKIFTLVKELDESAIEQAKQSVQSLNEALAARFSRQSDIRILAWVSDIHLHTDLGYDTEFRNALYTEHIDTRRQLRLALHEIAALEPAPELIIWGGDITDHGIPEEFQTFDRILREENWSIPSVPLFGNHDNKHLGIHPGVRELWPDIRREGWPELTDPDELYYSFVHNGLKFIVLDTLQSSKYKMSERQRSWLEEELRNIAQPTLVLCHRHLLPVGNWVDLDGLYREKPIWQMMDQCPHILGFFSGHVHYPRLWELKQKLYCTFPSLAYGIGAGTGWGGIVIQDNQIAAVFYKEIAGESGDLNACACFQQAGAHVFMEAESFAAHRLCRPGYWLT